MIGPWAGGDDANAWITQTRKGIYADAWIPSGEDWHDDAINTT